MKLNPSLSFVAALLFAGVASLPAQDPTPLLTQPEDQLIAVLQSNASQKEKADACRELAVVGTKAAVPALAALLGDEALSHMARYGLETIPDPSVDAALREALGRLKGRPLVGVIGSLGVRRDPLAVKPLTKLLQDPDADVAQAAARSLGRIATRPAVQALEGALARAPQANQLALCEGLLRGAEAFSARAQAKPAVAIYDRLRRQPHLPHQVRAAALRGAILARGKDGLPVLRQALQETDYILFAAAIRTSLELRGSEVTKLLADELTRASANRSTVLIGRTTPTLATQTVAERSPDHQVMLVQALGQRRDAAGVPVLAAAAQRGTIKGNVTAVRVAAIRALAEIGDASAAPLLADLAAERDREIAQAALESLAAMPGRDADAAVLALLDSGHAERRLAGIELIARRKMTSAVPVLAKAADDPDPRVRPAALKRLGEIAGPGEMSVLVNLLLQSRNAAEWDAAGQALTAVSARAGNPESCAAKLIDALPQAQPPQKGALLGVLSAVGGETARKTVRAAVDDSNAEVHAAALRALCEWRTADAGPDLLALAQSAHDPADQALCRGGCLRLAADPDLSADQRWSLCRQTAGLIQQDAEKKLLLGALGSVKTLESMALVATYLEQAAVREEACAAAVTIAEALLKGAGAPQSAPQLIGPLQQASQLAGNTDLARRAQTALRQAQDKAGGK